MPLPLPLPLPLLRSLAGLELDPQPELEELQPELLDFLLRARVTGPSVRPRVDGPAMASPRVDPGGLGLEELSLPSLLLLRAIFPQWK